MNRLARYLLWLIFTLLPGYSLAQHASPTQHTDTLSAHVLDTLQLSQAHLVPGHLRLWYGGTALQPSQYWLDPLRGRLYITDLSLPSEATLVAQYRSFGLAPPLQRSLLQPPAPAGGTHRPRPTHPDSLLLDSLAYYDTLTVSEEVGRRDARFFDQSELASHGSIARSITVGSNRDLAVNSSLRLQLEGKVANEIDVLASITDENIPIQPDGTTQQINDFDRVSIQIKKDRLGLTMGDYELIQKDTRFGNIYRNVLGLQGTYADSTHRAGLSISLAKGRFHSNSFMGQNGRQGPYRMQGKDNERFIIVLAGSEKVYLNGVLMQRGQGQDYVMDYNTGELTFMPRRLITANDRVVVDFEYAVQQYTRALTFGQYQGSMLDGRLRLAFSVGREADNPNNPLNNPLSADSREALKLAGDNPSAAYTSGIDSVSWNAQEILYQRADTTIGPSTYERYLYSTDSTVQLYRLSFVYVGTNKGSYTKRAAQVNGNIFDWVAPAADGTPLGDYQPLRIVPLPRRLAVANFRLELDLDQKRRWTVFTETAVSDDDRNRLSSLQDSDNQALATRSGLRLKNLKAGSWTLGGEAAYQQVDAQYENFDRVYQREYGRVWNYNDQGTRQTEKLGEYSLTATHKGLRLGTTGGYRQMADSLQTLRQELSYLAADTLLLAGQYQLALLQTNDNKLNVTDTWMRHNGDLFHKLGKLSPGIVLWIEDKQRRQTDSLLAGSFRFADLKPYLKWSTDKLTATASYQHRSDHEWLQRMRYKSLTETYSADLSWRPGRTLSLSSNAALNHYRVQDTAFLNTGLRDKETLVASLNGQYNSKNQGMQANVFYQILSESVAQRDVVYVEVTPGLGQYEWIDYNSDGVQNLNEFEVSVNPLIANYQRVLLPSQRLTPAIALNFSPQLTLVGAALAPSRRLLKPLTSISYLSTEQKRIRPTPTLSDYVVSLNLPASTDSSNLQSNLIFRQDLYLWRNGPNGDLRLRYGRRTYRQFLSSGYEQLLSEDYGFVQRKNFSRDLSLENTMETGYKSSYAQLLPGRNYHIDYARLNPDLSWQAKRRLRLGLGYVYTYKADQPTEGLQSYLNTHKVVLKSRINLQTRSNLNLRLELLDNRLVGDPQQSARFELLEGNQPGRNAVWSLLLTHYLGKNLELTVQYDGRASAAAPPLHTGRMQLRAVF